MIQEQWAEKGKEFTERSLERRVNIPLGGVKRLEKDNVHMDLDDKGENGFLPLVDLRELYYIAVKRVEGNVELYHTWSE